MSETVTVDQALPDQALIERAYKIVLNLHRQALQVEEQMDQCFKYSPFGYLPSKISAEARDIRKRLIDITVERLRQKYMPNAKPDVNFDRLMTDEVGETYFVTSVLENWFKKKTENPEELSAFSYKHIFSLAKGFVPYTSEGQPWGPLPPEQLRDRNVLTLRAYTWRGKGAYIPASLSYSLNDRGQYNALEKLIDIVILGKDPAAVGKRERSWLARHVQDNRNNPEVFYGKHEVKHEAVKAFQFFKNDKFRIWFHFPQFAEKVAFALCGKEAVTEKTLEESQ